MTKKEPKYRKQLNQGQLDVLELLFKFRFGTTELIANGLDKKNGTSIKSRLTILREQGFIDRRYDGTDKLSGKHASYYLKPEAIRRLRTRTNHTDITDVTIKNIYKDKTVSDQFIQHCLQVFAVYCRIKDQYSKGLKFFTKAGLMTFDYFPQPLPDAFLSLKNEQETKRFFLEVFESTTPAFVINRRIKQLINYFESGEWDATDTDFPTILIICDASVLQNRVEKRILTSLHNADDADDLVFATTNRHALTADRKVWRLAGEDELLSLQEM
jgi:hypothetical protein